MDDNDDEDSIIRPYEGSYHPNRPNNNSFHVPPISPKYFDKNNYTNIVSRPNTARITSIQLNSPNNASSSIQTPVHSKSTNSIPYSPKNDQHVEKNTPKTFQIVLSSDPSETVPQPPDLSSKKKLFDEIPEPYSIIIHTKTQSFEFRIPCLLSTLLIVRSLFQLQHYRLVHQTYFEVEQIFHYHHQTNHFVQFHIDNLKQLFLNLNLQKHWSVAENISNLHDTAISKNKIKHQLISHAGFMGANYNHLNSQHVLNNGGFGLSNGLSNGFDGKNEKFQNSLTNSSTQNEFFNPFLNEKFGSEQNSESSHDKNNKRGIFDKLDALLHGDLLQRNTKLDKDLRFSNDGSMISQRMKIQENQKLFNFRQNVIIQTVLGHKLRHIQANHIKELENEQKVREELERKKKSIENVLVSLGNFWNKWKGKSGQNDEKNNKKLFQDYLDSFFGGHNNLNLKLNYNELEQYFRLLDKLQDMKSAPRPPLLIIDKPSDKNDKIKPKTGKNQQTSTLGDAHGESNSTNENDEQSDENSTQSDENDGINLPIATQILRFQRQQKQYKRLLASFRRRHHKLISKSLIHDQNSNQNDQNSPKALKNKFCSSGLGKRSIYLDFTTHIKSILDDPDCKQYILSLMFQQYQTQNINQLLFKFSGGYNLFRVPITPAITPPPPYELKVILENNLVLSSPAVVEAALREHYLSLCAPHLTRKNQKGKKKNRGGKSAGFFGLEGLFGWGKKKKEMNTGEKNIDEKIDLSLKKRIKKEEIELEMERTKMGLPRPTLKNLPTLLRQQYLHLEPQLYEYHRLEKKRKLQNYKKRLYRKYLRRQQEQQQQQQQQQSQQYYQNSPQNTPKSSQFNSKTSSKIAFDFHSPPHTPTNTTSKPKSILKPSSSTLTTSDIDSRKSKSRFVIDLEHEKPSVLIEPGSTEVQSTSKAVVPIDPTAKEIDRTPPAEFEADEKVSNKSKKEQKSVIFGGDLPINSTNSSQIKYITRPRRYIIRYEKKSFSSKKTIKSLLQKKKKTTTFLYCPICKGSIEKTSAVVCIYCNSGICKNPTCCTTTASSLTSSVSMFTKTHTVKVKTDSSDPMMGNESKEPILNADENGDDNYNATDKDGIINKETHICTACVHELKQQYYKVGRGGNTAVIEFIGLEGLPPSAQGQSLSCDFFMEGSRQIVRTECHDANALFGARLVFSFLHTGQLSFTLRIGNKILGHSFITLSSLLNCDELKTIVFPIYAPAAIEKPTAERDQMAQNNLYTVPPAGTNDIETILTQRKAKIHASNGTDGQNTDANQTGDQNTTEDITSAHNSLPLDQFDKSTIGITGSFNMVDDQRDNAFSDQRIFNAMSGQNDFRKHVIARGVLRISMTVSWHELLFASMYEGWAPVPPRSFETSTLIYDVKRLVEIISSFQFSAFGQFFTGILHYRSPIQTIMFMIVALMMVIYLPAQAFVPMFLCFLIISLVSTYLFQVSVQHARDNALVNDVTGSQASDLQLTKKTSFDFEHNSEPSKEKSLIETFIKPLFDESTNSDSVFIGAPNKTNNSGHSTQQTSTQIPVSSLAGSCFDVYGYMRENGGSELLEDDGEPFCDYEPYQIFLPEIPDSIDKHSGLTSPTVVTTGSGQVGINLGSDRNDLLLIGDDGALVLSSKISTIAKKGIRAENGGSRLDDGDDDDYDDDYGDDYDDDYDGNYDLDDIDTNDGNFHNRQNPIQTQIEYKNRLLYEADWSQREERDIHLIHDLIDLNPPAVTQMNMKTGVRPQFDLTPQYPINGHLHRQNVSHPSNSTITTRGLGRLGDEAQHRDLDSVIGDKVKKRHKRLNDGGGGDDLDVAQQGRSGDNEQDDDSGLLNVYKRVNQTLTTIQGVIRTIADVCEKIQNIGMWTNPLVSTIIVVLLTIIAIALYIVPMRLLLGIVIIHQVSKKLRFLIKKTHVPDEITNIFQRIQTNRELYANQNSIDNAKLSLGQQNHW
jgi:hypothetical protein